MSGDETHYLATEPYICLGKWLFVLILDKRLTVLINRAISPTGLEPLVTTHPPFPLGNDT